MAHATSTLVMRGWRQNIVRTNHPWEIHTIFNQVVQAKSVTQPPASWRTPSRPPNWRLGGSPTGGSFLLLSHDLGQISFEIMNYSLWEFLQLLVRDPHKLSSPISPVKKTTRCGIADHVTKTCQFPHRPTFQSVEGGSWIWSQCSQWVYLVVSLSLIIF